MTTTTVVSMILILSMVMGGFGYFLSRAIKKERSNQEN